MKRHEYRDFNFWKKLDETDFAIISTVNNQALSVLINKMRGDRTLEKYAYECDVAIMIFCWHYIRENLRNVRLVLNTFLQLTE